MYEQGMCERRVKVLDDGVKTLLFGMRDLYIFHMSLCEEAGAGTTGGASELQATRDRDENKSERAKGGGQGKESMEVQRAVKAASEGGGGGRLRALLRLGL
jgi:hypothetical protein